jgi:spermidine synthase
MAESLFFYTRESAARIEIVEGDARLSLEQDTTPPFDVLALDAFSGDAIPLHLLTREAMALYVRHLKPDGVMVFHVSNNYLNLAPVVAQLANEIGYRAVDVKTHENPEELLLPTEWMLVSKNPAVFENETVQVHAQPIASRAGLRPWTDSFNNLAQIVQWPQLH